MKKIILLFALLPALKSFSQNNAIVSFKNPSSLSTPKGYSHAAVIDLGNCQMVILSGQVPLDNKGNLVGKDDFAKQTGQVFVNIRNAVTELGGTMNDIVKFGFFTTDASQLQTIRDIRDKYINTKQPPASTLVQVSKLYREDVFIEIEATVIIPKKQ